MFVIIKQKITSNNLPLLMMTNIYIKDFEMLIHVFEHEIFSSPYLNAPPTTKTTPCLEDNKNYKRIKELKKN